MKELVPFSIFEQLDIRIGLIHDAERIEKSDKLLRLQVTFGDGVKQQIVAGIGKAYQPDQLIGGYYAFVVNLEPITLMGVESHGMILATTDANEENLLSLIKSELLVIDGSIIS